MKKMTEAAMRTTNGGYIYTYYKCNICGSCLGTKWAITSHCGRKHGIKSCWKMIKRAI